MKKLTLHRETLQNLDNLEGVQGGLPPGTTVVREPWSAYQMSCGFSCARRCSVTDVPL